MSFTVNASGGMVHPHAVFSGKRNIAKVKLASLPKDGMSGEWSFSYSENGWVTQDIYIDIVNDLGHYIREQGIPIPVLLFLDGALCHLSLAISQLCDENKIQPILLRPNTTHLIQPLDVTFFSSLKALLKVEQELWHRKLENVGSSLSKYGVIPLVHGVTEKILETKPQLISNGFQKAGLFPWNPSAPTSKRMKPSQIYVSQPDPINITAPKEFEEERMVGMKSEPSVSDVHQTYCQFAEPGVEDTCGEISTELEKVSPTMAPEIDLPKFMPRFLAKYELLLSETELETFESLFAAKRFNIDHPAFQAWLVLKRASLPISEQEAMGQVLLYCVVLYS